MLRNAVATILLIDQKLNKLKFAKIGNLCVDMLRPDHVCEILFIYAGYIIPMCCMYVTTTLHGS